MNIKKTFDNLAVITPTTLVTNMLMTSTAAAQDKTSGFTNKVLEAKMVPDKVGTRFDDLNIFDESWIFSIPTREE